MPPTPLTAIAQTPRKELESKFTFNPVMAKVRIYANLSSRKRLDVGFYSGITVVAHLSFRLERTSRGDVSAVYRSWKRFEFVSRSVSCHLAPCQEARRARCVPTRPFVAGKSAFAQCPCLPILRNTSRVVISSATKPPSVRRSIERSNEP